MFPRQKAQCVPKVRRGQVVLRSSARTVVGGDGWSGGGRGGGGGRSPAGPCRSVEPGGEASKVLLKRGVDMTSGVCVCKRSL